MRRLRVPPANARWLVGAALLAAFLVSRLAFLDRDLPPWDLAMYQPIDEVAYVIPAFNLHHYGMWTHLEVAGGPLEGSPLTVAQSLLAAGTLALNWSYWGLRLSSVLLGLVAFAAMLATVRRIVNGAREEGVSQPLGASAIVGAAALLLLTDFSFLLAGRVVEPTIIRIAVVAVLLWLVARGSFLGPRHTPARSLVLGFFAGAAVSFVYIYNLFLIPGVLLAVAVWASRTHSWASVARHVALASIGIGVAVATYLVFVFVIYGHGPVDWYNDWLRYFRETGRATGFQPTLLWTFLEGNVFRLDRPFMILTLLMLPVYAWSTWRSRDPLGIVVISLFAAFAAQSTIQSDYPERKILILLALALPIVVGGIVRVSSFRSWLAARRSRQTVAAAWGAIVVVGTVLLVLPPSLTHWAAFERLLGLPDANHVSYREGLAGNLVSLGAVVGGAAVVVLVVMWHRAAIAKVAAAILLVAALGPMLNLDRLFVFGHVTTTFRDAMIAVRPIVDDRVTAGSWSFSMQLYNSSRPVLAGYVLGMSTAQYEAVLVRYFTDGRATSLFGYADPQTRKHLESLGFRLVEVYPIILPKDQTMGRYVYG